MLLNDLISTRMRFAESAAEGGSSLSRSIRANTDEFRLPTEEEISERELSDEASIAFSLAVIILVGSDIIWGFLGLVLLGDFRWAILVFLAVDVWILLAMRKPTVVSRVLVLARGLAGVGWFTAEAFLFDGSAVLPAGQAILLLAVAVLVIGRGGEGKVTAGVALALASLVLTFSVTFGQKQSESAELNRRINEAFELASVGRIGNAVDAMEVLLEENPDDAWIHMAAAELYRSDTISDLNRAIFLAERAVQLAPGEMKSRAYLVRAIVHQSRGEFPKAIASADSAINSDDGNPFAYLIRARLRMLNGQRRDAIKDLRKVEELAPGSDLGQTARLERLQIEGAGAPRITAPNS